MTALRDKIPVEPLDAERVVRIEHDVMRAYAQLEPSVHAPRKARARSLFATGLVAAAATAVLAFMWLRGERSELSPRISDPTRVATTDTPSRLQLSDSTINVGAHTTIDLFNDDRGTTIVLRDGRVDCEVEPRGHRPPFIVHAADVRVTVVGTVFSVERDGDDVRVGVRRGKVRVDRQASDGQPVFVRVNELWDAASDHKTALAPAGTKTAAATKQPGDDHSTDMGSHMVRAPHGVRKPNKRKHAPRRRVRTKRKRPAKTHRGKPAIATAGLPAALDGDPRELQQRGGRSYGADAEHAWYSAVYRYLERGQRRDALKLANYYLRRFNSGTYRSAVLWLKINMLCKPRVTRSCRTAAATYLQEFPNKEPFASQAAQLVSE